LFLLLVIARSLNGFKISLESIQDSVMTFVFGEDCLALQLHLLGGL